MEALIAIAGLAALALFSRSASAATSDKGAQKTEEAPKTEATETKDGGSDVAKDIADIAIAGAGLLLGKGAGAGVGTLGGSVAGGAGGSSTTVGGAVGGSGAVLTGAVTLGSVIVTAWVLIPAVLAIVGTIMNRVVNEYNAWIQNASRAFLYPGRLLIEREQELAETLIQRVNAYTSLSKTGLPKVTVSDDDAKAVIVRYQKAHPDKVQGFDGGLIEVTPVSTLRDSDLDSAGQVIRAGWAGPPKFVPDSRGDYSFQASDTGQTFETVGYKRLVRHYATGVSDIGTRALAEYCRALALVYVRTFARLSVRFVSVLDRPNTSEGTLATFEAPVIGSLASYKTNDRTNGKDYTLASLPSPFVSLQSQDIGRAGTLPQSDAYMVSNVGEGALTPIPGVSDSRDVLEERLRGIVSALAAVAGNPRLKDKTHAPIGDDPGGYWARRLYSAMPGDIRAGFEVQDRSWRSVRAVWGADFTLPVAQLIKAV